MFLDEYLYDAPWKDEIGPELLSFLDQQIQECIKNENSQYRLEDLIVYRVKWMGRLGKSKEEQEQYFAQYHYLPRIREIKISQAMQNSDWDTAFALLEESREIDKDKPGLVAWWKSFGAVQSPPQYLRYISIDGFIKYTFRWSSFSRSRCRPSPNRWKWTISRSRRKRITSFTSGSSLSRRILS